MIIIINHHIVVRKRQNRLKVGTDRPKLKDKMYSEACLRIRLHFLMDYCCCYRIIVVVVVVVVMNVSAERQQFRTARCLVRQY